MKLQRLNTKKGSLTLPSRRIFGISTALTGLVLATGIGIYSALFPQNPAYAAGAPTDFVTTWKTDNMIDGTSGDSSIRLQTVAGYAYNYDVDWDNDGTFDEFGLSGSTTHDFGVPGTYTIRIKGEFPYFGNGSEFVDLNKLLSIDQWGAIEWDTMYYAFANMPNLQIVATDAPDLSQVTDLGSMFLNSPQVNGDFSDWDVSNVANMSSMFWKATAFAGDVSSWDVSNVTNMNAMFTHAVAFNSDISGWDVSGVTNMSEMFNEARIFNRDLSSWDVSSVTDMSYMFAHTGAFNGDISGWDVSSVTDMTAMFANADSFNRSLGEWSMSSISAAQNMLQNTFDLSTDNYDDTIEGWATQTLMPNVDISQAPSYCRSGEARQHIIDTYNWSFGGDFRYCGVVLINGASGSMSLTRSDIGEDGRIGVLSVDGFSATGYATNCSATGADNDNFRIEDGVLYINEVPSELPEYFEVCIKGYDNEGRETAELSRTIVIDNEKKITGVEFREIDGKTVLVVTGVGFIDMTSEEYNEALVRSMASLNGVALPFCSEGFGGLSAVEIVDAYNVEAGLVSDDTPCYQFYDFENEMIFVTPTEFRIVVSSTFDRDAPGTVSVNGSPAFAFNQPDGEGNNDNENNGTDSTDSSGGGVTLRAPNAGDGIRDKIIAYRNKTDSSHYLAILGASLGALLCAVAAIKVIRMRRSVVTFARR